jgi:hypothetical protein
MSTPCRLTPELEERILAAIRAGGFPHVAAAAFGVPPRLFRKWLRRGRKRKSPAYEAFANNVTQAHATARLNAEMLTHQKDPKLWLRAGAGKETPGAPGWTTFARPQARRAGGDNPLSSPAVLRLLAAVKAALTSFPDALQAVVEVMASEGITVHS